MRIPYYSNLKQYLPSYYSDVLETKVLTDVEDKLYQEAVDVFNLVQDNQFVVSMDSNFISNMEKMLNINSTSEEGLEFRRARVLNRINNKPPFNLKYLIDKLDNIYGKSNYLLKINGLSTNQSIIEAFSDSEDGEGFTLDLKNSKYIGRIINDVSSYKFYKTPPTKGYKKGDLWAWNGEKRPSGYFIATKDNDMMDFNDWRYITKEDFEWKELSESYEDDYTIELESASLNSLWYREGFNTIMTIKPPNMEYIHKPLLFDNMVVEEGFSRATGERFTLGYSKLGSPLLKIGEYEEVNIL